MAGRVQDAYRDAYGTSAVEAEVEFEVEFEVEVDCQLRAKHFLIANCQPQLPTARDMAGRVRDAYRDA